MNSVNTLIASQNIARMIQTQLKFFIHLNLIPFLLKTYLASLIKNYICLFDDSINKGWMDIFI